ncbi:MAG: DUF485 domain-containing protein [Planctomycetes bacterium]|nr:DUF485 domain-containing protein [Planctomycetota bacterium]
MSRDDGSGGRAADGGGDGRGAATAAGLVLFAVYLLFYAGFVLLSALSPSTMDATPLDGINLAVLYGLGLIVGALVLALVYAYLCRGSGGRGTETETETEDGTP